MTEQNCDNFLSAVIRNETNTRVYDRNIPSQILQPYFSPRSVPTKYSLLPIVDPRKENSIKAVHYPNYNTCAIFNPGNDKAPWSGYSSNVNVESELRNQIFALQKCSQSVYVPGTNSDLYQNHFAASQPYHQPFSGLFYKEKFEPFNPNPENLATGVFLNSTRADVKNIKNDSCN